MLVPRMLAAAEFATAAGKIVGNVLPTGRVHGSLGLNNLALGQVAGTAIWWQCTAIACPKWMVSCCQR